MKKKVLRLGLVGCGAMGGVIARHVLKCWSGRAQWIGFYDASSGAAQGLAKACGKKIPFMELKTMLMRADWIIEAASPKAVPGLLRASMHARKNILIMSTAGLLGHEALLASARKAGIRVVLPSGAIAGVDAVKAAALGGIQSASLITVKPPKGLAGAPYLIQHRVDVNALTQRTVVFEGNAREAAKGFPTNVNVAATLALASGCGADKTRVTVVADPAATRNTHELHITGASGSIRCEVQNVPSPENPKTSALAVLSACAAIDELFTGVRVGT